MENFKDINVEMKNEYMLIRDISQQEVTHAHHNIIIPDERFKRFAIVLKVGEKSNFKVGDIIIKPIGRTTPIVVDGERYDCLKEGFVFAKVVEEKIEEI